MKIRTNIRAGLSGSTRCGGGTRCGGTRCGGTSPVTYEAAAA
jgi:hypothetical protein